MFTKIGTVAVSLALAAGALATPAFAKFTEPMGWKKPAVVSNRSYTLLHRGFSRHFGGFKVVGLKGTATRSFGPDINDYRLNYDKLTFVSGN